MLTIHQLEITIEAQTLLALDPYCGSALRGAFFHALWERFCANHEAKTCYECPLNAACPVATLVAPLRDESPRGRDIPRPYIITPYYTGKDQYASGETYTFGLSLLGEASKFYHYVMRAFFEMERYTLGHPLQELQGKRGRFRLCRVEEVHPFTLKRTSLWEQGQKWPAELSLGITVNDIRARAAQLSEQNLTIHFLSPTRLIAEQAVLHKPSFTALVLRLAERLEQIQQQYGSISDEKQQSGREWYLSLKAQAEEVELISDQTHWVDVRSYSNRQHQHISIGGLLGRATFKGPLTHLREHLIWGELLRVGKNIVKGAGYYQIEA